MTLRILALAFGLLTNEKTNSTSQVFVLRNELAAEWCAYRKAEVWRKESADLNARVVAVASYRQQFLLEIEIQQSDESGDWLLKDRYVFGKAGDVTDLQRTIDVLPEDLRRKQHYVFKAGRLIKSTNVTVSTTNTPLDKHGSWVPEFEMFKSVKGFPFATLLAEVPRHCLPESFPQSVACFCQKGRGL